MYSVSSYGQDSVYEGESFVVAVQAAVCNALATNETFRVQRSIKTNSDLISGAVVLVSITPSSFDGRQTSAEMLLLLQALAYEIKPAGVKLLEPNKIVPT